MLLLSGGVSAGKADLVPQVLHSQGVEQIFHKVAIKPGKPVWFGKLSSNENGRPCLVFGLPGNPASSLACFHVFVLPALRRLFGMSAWRSVTTVAKLSKGIDIRGGRTTYWPAVLSEESATCEPLDWRGSADIRAVSAANCLAIFPSEQTSYKTGEEIRVLRL